MLNTNHYALTLHGTMVYSVTIFAIKRKVTQNWQLYNISAFDTCGPQLQFKYIRILHTYDLYRTLLIIYLFKFTITKFIGEKMTSTYKL